MNAQITEFLDRIRQLEADIELEVQRRRQQFQADFDQRKVKFEHEVLDQQRRFKEGVVRYVLTSDWRHLLTIPLIYPVLLPMVLLDGMVTLYQWVCFPLYNMPRVRRSDYFVYDRTHLAYLNIIEKINCAYCSYGNGLMAYAREVVGLTEQYWCPIKHARRVVHAHPHYHGFSDYGDAQSYREQLAHLRLQLQQLVAQPLAPEVSQHGQPVARRLDKVIPMKTFETLADLAACVGQDVAITEWVEITQQQVNLFADATGDHQWIHVDVERAKAGPFGGTIAHGYLTMSLVNYFLPQLIEVRGFAHAVNVGADRLRFLAPVKVGALIRGVGEIVTVEEIKGAIQSVVRVTVEIEGPNGQPTDKPACVVDTISRYFPA